MNVHSYSLSSVFSSRLLYRLLQISSFNGKMNALNEVNKVISSVSYYTHRHGNPEEEEWLTAERMAVRAALRQYTVNQSPAASQSACRRSLYSVQEFRHWLGLFINNSRTDVFLVTRAFLLPFIPIASCFSNHPKLGISQKLKGLVHF